MARIMILFGYLWLTLGLLILLTQAAETTTADESTATAASLLKIWDLDSGCDNEMQRELSGASSQRGPFSSPVSTRGSML